MGNFIINILQEIHGQAMKEAMKIYKNAYKISVGKREGKSKGKSILVTRHGGP
jgi:hypothetical protein